MSNPFLNVLFQGMSNFIGVIVCFTIGILFVLLLPWIALIFCCCRCCDKCGGKREQENSNLCCKQISLSIGLTVSLAVLWYVNNQWCAPRGSGWPQLCLEKAWGGNYNTSWNGRFKSALCPQGGTHICRCTCVWTTVLKYTPKHVLILINHPPQQWFCWILPQIWPPR